MQCRAHCGACCIAPSISSPIPGMPDGKQAGQACIHLTNEFRCAIFNDPNRPQVCHDLQPTEEMCGNSREQALRWLGYLEEATCPSRSCKSAS
ncbi:MAG: zinc/iron-chelating domain-containing protein [Pusillimonas sp.]|nr:zinc/iron-chelating domain-containing protein [Pusillimonas sp.]